MKYADESGWSVEPKHLAVVVWYAYLRTTEIEQFLGSFPCFEEARGARKAAERMQLDVYY